MKRFVSSFFIFLNFSCMFSQNFNHFRLYDSNSNFSIEIYFYPSKTFYIDFTYFWTDDIIMDGMLATGKYHQKGDSIIFVDELTRNIYIIVKDKGKYVCGLCFDFMNGRVIELSEGNIEEYGVVKNNYENIISMKHTISSFLHSKDKINSTFNPGLYYTSGSIENRSFYIVFNKNGSFLYILDRHTLLKGKWETKGSLLVLRDENFCNPFYMQIKNEKELIGLSIPGNSDYNSFRLYSGK